MQGGSGGAGWEFASPEEMDGLGVQGQNVSAQPAVSHVAADERAPGLTYASLEPAPVEQHKPSAPAGRYTVEHFGHFDITDLDAVGTTMS